MNPARPFSAVTFDLDGTLYPFAPVRWRFVLRNWRRLRILTQAMAFRERVRGQTFEDREAFRREEEKAVAAAVGKRAEVVRPIIDQMLEASLCRVLKRVGPSPDARKALQALVDAGIKVAVVSDYHPHEKLKALGLADIPFAALIAADELGALKPDARAFDAAVAALEVEPAQMAHVGDRLDADVRGAQAAGIWPILLKNPQDVPPLADGWICRNLQEAVQRVLSEGRPPPPLTGH
jgi:HAD superfamily hydrolase (TIGR01509 family)